MLRDTRAYLQACLRAYWQGDPLPDLTGLEDPVGLARLAVQQGVGALLYRALKAAGPLEVPGRILGVLRPYYLAAVAQAALQVQEVQRLQQAFARAGVPALFYKGVVLGQLAYGDPALRPATDIDVLVMPAAFKSAESVLLTLGYQRDVPHQGLVRRVYLCFQREHPYRLPDRMQMVDLHLSIAPWRFAPVQPVSLLWTDAMPVLMGSQTVWTLAPEALLPLLCLHCAKHQWRTLKWINDVAALLRAFPELDWERLWAWARQWQGVRMLRLGLQLAHEGLGAPLPSTVLRSIGRDRQVERLVRRVREGLYRPDVWRPFWQRFIFHLRSREHPLARWRYVLLSSVFYTMRPILGLQH
ncbi:MAG: nucleotidyltransferase family protein [Rhodothermus sp.]|nr:nucleotidyltransferase family protein [Rhodothermus sp.]